MDRVKIKQIEIKKRVVFNCVILLGFSARKIPPPGVPSTLPKVSSQSRRAPQTILTAQKFMKTSTTSLTDTLRTSVQYPELTIIVASAQQN